MRLFNINWNGFGCTRGGFVPWWFGVEWVDWLDWRPNKNYTGILVPGN